MYMINKYNNMMDKDYNMMDADNNIVDKNISKGGEWVMLYNMMDESYKRMNEDKNYIIKDDGWGEKSRAGATCQPWQFTS